jgi:hypothetical protein
MRDMAMTRDDSSERSVGGCKLTCHGFKDTQLSRSEFGESTSRILPSGDGKSTPHRPRPLHKTPNADTEVPKKVETKTPQFPSILVSSEP